MKWITCQGGRLLTLGDMPGEGLHTVATPACDVPSFTTGLPPIDALAPGAALRRRAIHEVLSEPSHGTPLFFAMLLARAASNSGVIVWCDPGHEIYPPALAAQGVDLDRLYLLQPKTPAEQAWAVAECLKCKGVAAVVAEMKQRLSRLETRRLQLSAERGGGVGILLRAAGKVSAEHAAATRWLVRPAPGERTVQRWEVQLVHGHGGRVGQAVILEHSRETNRVRAVEELVDRRRRTEAGPPARAGVG
jgi:protein ImuA